MTELPKYDENGVVTTAYMDGIYTQEDYDNRYEVMMRCSKCETWNQQHHKAGEPTNYTPCSNCGLKFYNSSTLESVRTWNPNKGKKKRKNDTEASGRDAWNNPNFIKSKFKKK